MHAEETMLHWIIWALGVWTLASFGFAALFCVLRKGAFVEWIEAKRGRPQALLGAGQHVTST
jgi:hypothetical protein